MRVGMDGVSSLSQRQLRGQAFLLAILPHDPRPQPPQRWPWHQRTRGCSLSLLIVYNNLNGVAFPAHHPGRYPLWIPKPSQLQGHCWLRCTTASLLPQILCSHQELLPWLLEHGQTSCRTHQDRSQWPTWVYQAVQTASHWFCEGDRGSCNIQDRFLHSAWRYGIGSHKETDWRNHV